MPTPLFGRPGLNRLESELDSRRIGKSAGSYSRNNSGGATVFTPLSRLSAVAASHAYKGTDASSGTSPQVYIQIGSHNGIVPTIDGVALSAALTANILALGSSDTQVYVELDVVSGAIGTAEISSTASTGPPADSISGGTGTAYQTLFYTSISTSGSVTKVRVSDNVSGSQAFQVCSGNTALYGLV